MSRPTRTTATTITGWAICVPTDDGPSVAVRSMTDDPTGVRMPHLPLIWGPHAKGSALDACRAMNAPLPDPLWTVEPVTITAGSSGEGC